MQECLEYCVIKHNKEQLQKCQRPMMESHLGCQIIPGCQMLKTEEAVPLAGSTSAGVVVHNLTHKIKSTSHPDVLFPSASMCLLSARVGLMCVGFLHHHSFFVGFEEAKMLDHIVFS